MSDQRARVVLDAPVNEAALSLLTPVMQREIAEEVRAVFQNALIVKGVSTRYESERSAASVHFHNSSGGDACIGCIRLAQDDLSTY